MTATPGTILDAIVNGAPAASRETDQAAARAALQGALVDSRDRWRDLALMAADLAFETDAWGRLTFVAPDPALGWGAASLLGQPAELLLADQPGDARDARAGRPGPAGRAGVGCNPFRPSAAVRGRRAWLRHRDGRVCCVSFTAAPLLDEQGRVRGARGAGIDLTEQEGHDAHMAAALRRAEIVDHILSRMRQEVLAPRAMQAVLGTLASALGAEGAAVIDLLADLAGTGAGALHHAGNGLVAVHDAVMAITRDQDAPSRPGIPANIRLGRATLGQGVMAAVAPTRFGGRVALALWRAPGGRAWDDEDQLLALAVANIALTLLEHETLQREMALQARTDPLTGLLNRRAFLEELPRHIDRLDRDAMSGTLIFADLDNFKQLNDRLGHEIGDRALCAVAGLLRATFRPTDLVARLGGDEFAVWMNGADHLTAAERAEALRVGVPRTMADITGPDGPGLSLSIGIAPHAPRHAEDMHAEDMDGLFRRADLAMYEVKRSGRAHWRVAPAGDP